jgi:hypothetical protein
MKTHNDAYSDKFYHNILEHTVNNSSKQTPDYFSGSGAAGCIEEPNSQEGSSDLNKQNELWHPFFK